MKHRPMPALAFALSLLLQQSPAVSEPFRVGVSYPLTGPVSIYGKAQMQGLELAAEELNAMHGAGGHPVELVVEDNAFEAKRQLSAVRKLIDRDRIDALVTGWTPLTIPILKVIDQARIPTFTWMVTEAGHLSPYLFNIKNDFADAARAMVKVAAGDGVSRLALLAVRADELVKTAEAIRSEASLRGVDIVADYEFGTEERDFRTILARVKHAKPDAIVLAAYPGNWQIIVRQLSELGLDRLRLFDLSMSAPDPKINTDHNETMLRMNTISNWYSTNPDHPASSAFNSAFRRRYGTDPEPYAAYSYDTLRLLAAAAGRCYGKRAPLSACLRDELQNIGFQDGASGGGTMDEDGDFELPSVLVRRDGKGWRFMAPR